MQVTISAVGPDNRGLADPIIHYVTGQGANIAEIQMYDHDEECLFAMMLRIELARERYDELRTAMQGIGRDKDLSIRVWSPELRAVKPRLAICTTLRPEAPLALLRAVRDGRVQAEAAVMIGNRPTCRSIAEQFDLPWQNLGDDAGNVNDDDLVALVDQYDVDYVILARYMRVLSAAACTTACCRASPAYALITRPTPAACSPTAPPATSSSPNSTPATRSSTNRPLRSRRA
jgi:formyltetrahydrofolate deformylase